MWRELETDAIRIGLSLDYFWTLNPKQWIKHVRVFNEREQQRVKEIDTMNYLLGKYIGWAINDPKHYPKEPFTEKHNNRVMTDEEMEKQGRRNTIKMGGVIK